MDYADFIERKGAIATPAGLPDVPPLGDYLFPFQKDCVAWALRRGKAALFESVGLGKALAADAPVLTIDGWRPIASIVVGDLVYGADGEAHAVTGVFPQGERELYRVTFTDSGVTVCDADHLWSVRDNNQRHRTLTLRQIMAEGIMKGMEHKHFIPIVDAIQMPHVDMPIDPYTLGVILGDGGLTRHSVSVSTDDEIVARLVMPDDVEIVRGTKCGQGVYTCTIRRIIGSAQKNALTVSLENLGLMGLYSHEKFIPAIYMTGSVEQRKELLAGLLDTDGNVEKLHGITVEYTTSSPRLAADVRALVLSLGGIVHTGIKKEPKYQHKGEERTGPTRAIHAIEPAGVGQAVCISVDSPDHLFVTGDYVLTHNTRQIGEFCAHASAYQDSIGERSEVLIVSPLGVAAQTVRELDSLGMTAKYCKGPEDIRTGAFTVTNYDRVDRFNVKRFGVGALDESSILKHDTSKTRIRIIDAFKGMPFLVSATATPSPNDRKELGGQAELLGVMTEREMLSEYFVHDAGNNTWRLKGHAEQRFWQWVASWGAMITKPSDLGYPDDGYILPPLTIVDHVIGASIEQDRIVNAHLPQLNLIPMPARSLKAQRKARRITLAERVKAAVEIILAEPWEQWLVWCELNDESDALIHALAAELPGAVEIQGKHSAEKKESAALGFANGSIPILVSKSSIFGYGLNFQSCARTCFVGVTHKFEEVHQALGRNHRFGQKREVHAHFVYSELEGDIRENLRRKSRDFQAMADSMRGLVAGYVQQNMRGTSRDVTPYNPNVPMAVAPWLVSEAS